MSETTYVDALEGARAVRAAWIGGYQYIAVWHGGVGFNVYCEKTGNEFEEVDYFTLSDEEGRGVKRHEAMNAMWEHFERVAEEAGVEVLTG